MKEEIFDPGLGEEGSRVYGFTNIKKTCKRGKEEILEKFRVLQTAKKKCKGEREREREREILKGFRVLQTARKCAREGKEGGDSVYTVEDSTNSQEKCKGGKEEILEQFRVLQTAKKLQRRERERERERERREEILEGFRA